jgi:hypothetical protein
MEPQFRPIPITILDLLAILLPGFVWLVLLCATLQILMHGQVPVINSSFTAWERFASVAGQSSSWVAASILVTLSLVVGYALKPVAMRVAGLLAEPTFRFGHDIPRGFDCDRLFPFAGLYQDTEQKVSTLLKTKVGCPPRILPGHHPFASAKRFLRLNAPTLWEESERMEAEVRMTGVLFLGACYSLLLSGGTLVFQFTRWVSNVNRLGTFYWFIASLLAAFVLSQGFNHLRVREVGYTYINLLMACGCQAGNETSKSQPSSPEVDSAR